MKTRLLANGVVVTDGRVEAADVLIRGDRIERVGYGDTPAGTEVLDIAGCHVLPGLIDDQVHFREPGLTHKADIGTESLAALCGGVTSYLDMPNNSPPCTDRAGLAFKKQIAARSSYANYGFYLGATNTNLDEIRAVSPQDACGIKVFMGASTGNMLVDDKDTLAAIFAEAALPVVTHCEDSPMIWAAEQRAREQYGEDVPMREHVRIRSAEACYRSSSTAVALAEEHGTRLHVLHLTTARELALFQPGPIDGKRITAEVCVHHLWYDESDYAELGTLIKCNPSIKTAADRAGLREAVSGDVIDIIATDHAPHTREEKDSGYFDAPSGLPLVQHSLQMLLELHHEGFIGLAQVVQKAAHNPAALFRIRDRGHVREGYIADLAVVDLDAPMLVDRTQLKYKCGWSPLEGTRFRSSIVMTLLGGEVVFDHGQILDRPLGQELEFVV